MQRTRNLLDHNKRQTRIAIFSVIGLVAAIGLYMLMASHAQSQYVAKEAETGALVGGATQQSDPNASGGKAIQFGVPPGGQLLWSADYNQVTDPLAVTQVWWREQEPHNPGLDGPLATDRIRVVNANEVPGSGVNKPNGKAMRVELRPYDDGNGDVNASGSSSRAEVYGRYPTSAATSTPPEKWPDPVGSTRWYSFSVYIPPDFTTTTTSDWFTLTQWKGFYGASPPQSIEIKRNAFRLGGTHSNRDLGAIGKDSWTKFVIGFHWSNNATDGWVHIFRNGVEVVPQETRATMDSSGGKADPIYLKQGIYRTKAWTVTHVLYFGPTKVGTTKQSVE